MRSLATLFTLFVGRLLGGAAPALAVDYAREVKPLLAKHCVSCHGDARPRGGLRLDTAAGAIIGGKNGPSIVAGKSDESPLVEAVRGEGATDRMPLKRAPLAEREIEILARWIDEGAKAPPDEIPTALNETHWAFIPPKPMKPPSVSDPAWLENPIDAFVLARLDQAGVAPSLEADRRTLFRRASLDLTGLPPTIEEVDAFVTDARPDAYERAVDRLLASPCHGEKWARPWLDLARYADSNGYSIDAPRSIWKYRDWVIDALNRDLPFDEFTIEQLAGDLSPDRSLDRKVATGFHRNTPINQEGGIDLEQFRVESIVDRVNTTATAFLGLTLGCAQCHDHKYDPLSQREYYAFFAFFNSVDEPEIEFATAEQKRARDAVLAELAAAHERLKRERPEIPAKEREWESTLPASVTSALPPELKNAFDRPIEKRTDNQWRGLTELFLAQSEEFKSEHASIAALRATVPKFDTSLVVQVSKSARPTFIHLGGDFTRKGDAVEPGVPRVLSAFPSTDHPPDRMDLARWLVDPANPLTARVAVNRIWQAYFGRGLVETENDFGTQGAPPSHPELLDWLARELVASGWRQKAMHRLIVTSKTYRQSSKVRADLERADPDNRLLARQSRLRLDAEVIRDSALAASDLLATKVGGPSVFPPQPEGVMNLGQLRRPWIASTGPDRYRRGLYTFFWRATPHPSLTVFDAPNGVQSCTRRPRSNTPVQALTLLNDQAYFECAEALAKRLLEESGLTNDERVELAFRLTLGRPPSEIESKTLAAMLDQERREVARTTSSPSADRAAWTTAARVLLNLDEFITRE